MEDNKSEHEYATLSHYWGQNPIITLRQENISGFQDPITMTALLLVSQQAIYVARRLGFAFLWIDSLCIIQDSEEDWRHESALIGKVYSNSTLNIMATDSKDGTQGLFRAYSGQEVLWTCNTALFEPSGQASHLSPSTSTTG